VSRLVRAELLKQRTTRSSLLTLVSMVALVLLLILLHGFSLSTEHISTTDAQLKVVGWGTSIGALFAALLGAISITGEIRNGTIRPTFLATPKRERVVLAKLLATSLIGVGIGLVAEGLCAGIEGGALAIRGIHVQLSAGDYLQLLAGGAAAGAFFAAIGLGVGAVVRQQVAAVIGLTLWLILIETTLIGNVPSVGKFAPGAAAGAITGAIQTQSASDLVAPGIGVLLLAVYAAIAGTAGIVTTNRRDVA
jgi:ABC-2 type transport system permease protein